MDEQIGRLLQEVDLRKTWVMFISDHGDMQMDHWLFRKGYPYEGSTHVPFVLAWPYGKMLQPGPRHTPVELRDVFPTLVGAVGLNRRPEVMDVMASIDGIDLACSVKYPNFPAACGRDYVDMEHNTVYADWNHWSALTDGKWKYIFFADGSEREQLFNLQWDPKESRNLANDEMHQGQLEMWRKRLIAQFRREGRGADWVQGTQLMTTRTNQVFSLNYNEGNVTNRRARIVQQPGSSSKGSAPKASTKDLMSSFKNAMMHQAQR